MRGRLRSLLVVGLLALTSGAVQADSNRGHDANDASGPLDIAWIEHGHRTTEAGARRLVHTVRLYDRWAVDDLRNQGFINLFFDLKGNPDWREDRAVYISYEKGKLRAELYNFAADPPHFLRTVPLRRPDARTVRVLLRKHDLRNRPFDHYRWSAVSFVQEQHRSCGKSGGCDDYAPDGGYLRHGL